VSLGSLSFFRDESPPRAIFSPASSPPNAFARYLIVAVPQVSASPNEGNVKWLSEVNSQPLMDCLRKFYPNHDLSAPFSSPFLFQQPRRFGMGQQRAFSSFGQGPNKRANFGV
jgi:hypothetical protein